jgi:hypothetical protein
LPPFMTKHPGLLSLILLISVIMVVYLPYLFFTYAQSEVITLPVICKSSTTYKVESFTPGQQTHARLVNILLHYAPKRPRVRYLLKRSRVGDVFMIDSLPNT